MFRHLINKTIDLQRIKPKFTINPQINLCKYYRVSATIFYHTINTDY